MPSNNSKYTAEFREQTARHIIETGKSATSMAEELSIDVNTVCRWVRIFRNKNGLPSWSDERNRKIIKDKARGETDVFWENKALLKELKKKEKLIFELEEEKAILKKSLAIFAQPLA